MKNGNNNTSAPLGITKNHHWMDLLYSGNAQMAFPEKEDWRKRFIYSLFEWFDKNPEAVVIEDFFHEYRIPRPTFQGWHEKYEDIKRAYAQVKVLIGARRRSGAIKGKFNYNAAYRDMHCYDSEWKEINAYHAKLRDDPDNRSDGKTQFVVIKEIEYRDNPKEGE